jgi:hypothetical protein
VSELIFFSDSKLNFLSSIVCGSQDSKIIMIAIVWGRKVGWIGEFSVESVFESLTIVYFGWYVKKIDCLAIANRNKFWLGDNFYFSIVAKWSKCFFDTITDLVFAGIVSIMYSKTYRDKHTRFQ